MAGKKYFLPASPIIRPSRTTVFCLDFIRELHTQKVSVPVLSLAMTFIEILGYILVFIILYKILGSVLPGIYLTFVAPALGAGVNWKKLGKWAVVTGSTDGIGKAYAEALAKKGFNIVLISRTQEKLDAVAQEIEKLAKVQTKTIAVNFTAGLEMYDTIRKGLEGLEVGVLVNNVGMSLNYPEFYTMIPEGEQMISDILNTNALSCSMMMRLVLPQMSDRKSGVIINVSSLSAVSPVPLLSIYGATKAYMEYMSKSLQAEYKRHNIIIQCVLPGFVTSKMSKLRKTSFMVPNPQAYVRWAMKTVGIEEKTAAYPAHKLMAYVAEMLYHYAPGLSVSVNFKHMLKTRKANYRRKNMEDPLCTLGAPRKQD